MLIRKRWNAEKYLDGVSRLYGRSYQAWGYKAKIKHLEKQMSRDEIHAYLTKLSSNGWKIISLTRANIVKTALSTLTAYKRGGSYHSKGDFERRKVEVPIHNLNRQLGKLEKTKAKTREVLDGIDHLSLVYEKDLESKDKIQSACEKVFVHLGVAHIKVESKFRKISTGRLSDDLANAEEIYDYLMDSKYSSFLADLKL